MGTDLSPAGKRGSTETDAGSVADSRLYALPRAGRGRLLARFRRRATGVSGRLRAQLNRKPERPTPSSACHPPCCRTLSVRLDPVSPPGPGQVARSHEPGQLEGSPGLGQSPQYLYQTLRIRL